MKKTILTVLLILCMIFQTAIPVSAKDKTVEIESCTLTTSSATVTGKGNGATAIMVRIRDASKEVIALQSFPVAEDDTFSATLKGISLTRGATYTVSVADYEGGPWTTTEATVSSPSYDPTPSEPTATPTPDATPTPTSAPTPEPAFDEIVTEEGSEDVTAVFDAGEIGEEPVDMAVALEPEDEESAALLDALLTDEQKAAYESDPVQIILSVSATKLSSEEKKACEEDIESLEAMMADEKTSDKNITVSDELATVFSGDLSAPADENGEAGTPEIVIVKAYDFTVSMKIGDRDPIEIHDLGAAKMAVRFAITKTLKNTDPSVQRIFFMIHLKSDGKTEILPVTVNLKKMNGTVEFDECSTFILAYTDVARYTEAGSTLTSSKYNAKYKIIEGGDVNGKVGVLEYVSPITKKARHTVYSKVTIDGITYKVTSIAAKAFSGNKTLTKIKIGKYITSIGDKAFYKAKTLEKVVIKSKKLKSANIGASVFSKAGGADGIIFIVPSSKLKSYKKLFGKIGTVKAK